MKKLMTYRTVLVGAILVTAIAASYVAYESLKSTAQSSSLVRTITPFHPQCGRVSLVERSQFQLTFNSTVSCFEGFPSWGADVSVGWVSVNGSVNLAATWSCLGLGCAVQQPVTAYNMTGSSGSFSFNVSSLGNQWENVSAIDFTFWASPVSNMTSPLHPGQQVNLVGAVN